MLGRHLEDEMENTAPKHTNKNRKSFTIKPNIISCVATQNVNLLIQTGKLKVITDLMYQHKILIKIPKMRNTDLDPFESRGYKIYKGIPGKRPIKNVCQ